jgi:spore coat protein H
MAYGLFEKAGAIAPRCNFARVVVNGEDLGIYTHVESVKKPMLRRHFEDDDGNLYEGQAADFVDVSVDRIELKTNEVENDRSDLDAVVNALLVDDNALIEALGEVIDLDSFLTFWAMEVMTAHWDSYSGGRNNYLTYHDPTSDRFHFIPWGTDGAFTGVRLFNPANTAVSVLAEGRIANRLYAHPEGRAMYFARLGELFEEVWHEEELASEAERIGALTEASEELITTQRDFIFRQGNALRAELMIASEDAPAWIDGPEPRPEPDNCDALNLAGMNGTFETVWRIGLPGPGGSANVIFAGNPILTGSLLTSAGVDPAVNPNVVNILLVSPVQGLAVLVRVPLAYFEPGRTIAMHGFESNAILLSIDLASSEFELLGFVGGGTITFDEASTVPGQPVSGSFEGLFAQINVF